MLRHNCIGKSDTVCATIPCYSTGGAGTVMESMYIGHGVYRTQENPTTAWFNKKELPNEIAMLRNNSAIQGSIYFSAVSILRNPNGWADSLRLNEYSRPALLPPMPWIDTVPPQRPVIADLTESSSKSDSKFTLKIKPTRLTKQNR